MTNDGWGDVALPSGNWTGFYLYESNDVRHRMKLELRFEGSCVRGSGQDGIGDFLVDGDLDRVDRRIVFRKSYLDLDRLERGDSIVYEGHVDGNGIWGEWQSRSDASAGGFRIWPDADASAGDSRDDDTEVRLVELPYLRSAVGFTGHSPFGNPF